MKLRIPGIHIIIILDMNHQESFESDKREFYLFDLRECDYFLFVIIFIIQGIL